MKYARPQNAKPSAAKIAVPWPLAVERLAPWLALAYLALLVLPFRLGERALVADVLVPLMGAFVLLRSWRNGWRTAVRRWRWLLLWLALAAVAAVVHAVGSAAPRAELYEWAVFAYMGVVFVFYAETLLVTARAQQLCCALLTACLLAFVGELTGLTHNFSFVSEQMTTTSMSFLAKRFAFTMGNPNLFGVFYAIPCALLARLVLQCDWRTVSWRVRGACLLLGLCLMLPLLSSASKHGLLSAALLAGCLPVVTGWQKLWAKGLCVLALAGLAVVFELTVLFTVFPLSREQRYVIRTTPGMYALHQGTYARLLADRPSRLWLGIGEQQAQALYGSYTQPQVVRETLEHYNAMASYENFLSFMDPHNEFLNTATLFGLPALLAAVVFWLSCVRQAPPSRRFAAALLVGAVLACCLWDDLFSKRCLWVAAAIMLTVQIGDKKHHD